MYLMKKWSRIRISGLLTSKDIRKYRSDVIKLVATISGEQLQVSESIKEDLTKFIYQMNTEQPVIKDVLKQIGIKKRFTAGHTGPNTRDFPITHLTNWKSN